MTSGKRSATHHPRRSATPSTIIPQPGPSMRRRRCKFIREWLAQQRQFARWLRPVRGDEHRAHCLLCDKAFSVAHGGLHDVRAHWKGKRHAALQARATAASGLNKKVMMAARMRRSYAASSSLLLLGRSFETAVVAAADAKAPDVLQGQQGHFGLVLSTKEKESHLRPEQQHQRHKPSGARQPLRGADSFCREAGGGGGGKDDSSAAADSSRRQRLRLEDEAAKESSSRPYRVEGLARSGSPTSLPVSSASSEAADEEEPEEAALVALVPGELACSRATTKLSSRLGALATAAAANTAHMQQQPGGSGPGCPLTPPQQQQHQQQQAGGPAGNSSNMFPQQYCLRWKYHHSNLQTMFSQLLERQAYCDVTLACEGKTLRAHKVVLSACSTYFDTILSQYEEKDPIVIMRDVKFCDIKVLVEFMYKGEINIDHTRLSSLLKTAEDLHIKGLAEVSWRSDSGQNDLSNSGHSPGSGPPGVETVLREGVMEPEEQQPPPPKQRRRGRPPLDDPPSAHDVFTPKITCITGNQEEMSEGDHESWDDEMMMPESNEAPMPIQLSYMPKDDSMQDQEKKANTSTNSNALNPSIPEQFRDVVKMNDYLTTGRRQEFWEEPFTRRVMDAIKSKELEMKTAAEILGVSYGTLYGRYRDSYGCLKHPYRVRDFWSEPGPAEILAKLRRKEITLFRAAEFLNVTVHTLATYLSTLQGPDRISLAGDLSVAAAGPPGPTGVPMDTSITTGNSSEADNAADSMNDLVQKMSVNAAAAVGLVGGVVSAATAPTTSTTIKREGGGYVELPSVGHVPKAATSVLENNPDITIVKTEGMQRKRQEYAKLTATENNNAKLMSGGAVSEMAHPQLSHPGPQSQPQPTPQQLVTQSTVSQHLQQHAHQHPPPHQQKLGDALSMNNDISKP